MADQNITNWDAVAKHLAIEIMGWHKGDIGKAEEYPGAYHDSKNNWIMPIREWQPYEHWGQIGRVIDKMKERGLRCTLITWLAFGSEARFYNNQKERLGHATGQHIPQQAIALAAALATGYVEKEKTEAEILLSELRQEGLYCMEDTKEHILELFEQSFERVRKEEGQRQSQIIEELRLIDKKKNDEGMLLIEIRERLLTKGDSARLWLTVTEDSILRSIEKWQKERAL